MITQARLKELVTIVPPLNRFMRLTNASGGCTPGDIAGFKHFHGHREIKVDGKLYREHVLVWLYINGEWPTEPLHHINKINDDNDINNLCYRDALVAARERFIPDFTRPLRACDPPRNKPHIQPPNSPPPPLVTVTRPKSKFTGVYWHDRGKKWIARKGIERIGEYNNETDAIAARKIFELFI